MSSLDLPDAPAPGDWESWRPALAERLRGLADREVLVLTAVGVEARPSVVRPARARGLIGARTRLVQPYIRFLRVEDQLRGECIGATRDGGTFPFTDEEAAALEAFGWHAAVPAEGATHYQVWWPDDVPSAPYLPPELVAAAVDRAERTLRDVIGLGSPDGIDIDLVASR